MELYQDGSEHVRYDYDGCRAYIRRARLSVYPNYAAESHWHDDIELVLILSGKMQYNVNGKIMHLDAGQAIFVNARQLHYGFSAAKEDCEFLCILLHPMMLCTTQQIEREYVAPILSDAGLPCLVLREAIAWQREALADIRAIYEERGAVAAPLAIQSRFSHFWMLLYRNAAAAHRTPPRTDRNLSVLRDMIGFIQKNYSERISLQEIAAAGSVSKSTCLALFRRYLHDTPTDYLIRYRIRQAALLLTETDCTVCEAALATGFQGASYFSETFRRCYGCTPTAYRKNVLQPSKSEKLRDALT